MHSTSLSISRPSPVCPTSLAYLMDFVQPNRIGIEPLMSQEVPGNPEIHNDATRSWCDLHSRQYRTTQAKGTCFMVYLLSNSRYQIPIQCVTSWRSISNVAILQILGRTPYKSTLRHTSFNRSRIYRIGGACSEAPDNTSLGELARKL